MTCALILLACALILLACTLMHSDWRLMPHQSCICLMALLHCHLNVQHPELCPERLQCRFIMRKKKLLEKIDIESPKVFGGMKTDEFLALNPQGLIPALVFPDGKALWESDVRPSAAWLCWHSTIKYFLHNGATQARPIQYISVKERLWLCRSLLHT